MLRKTKSLLAAGAVMTALTGAAPAAADTAALAACRAVATTTTTSTLTVVVQGQYVAPGPYDVRLTCYVKQNGATVASFTDATSGPVAVIAGTATIPLGPYQVCHTAFIRNLADGSSRSESSC